jgi:opacity protein-like surface antigen
MSRTHAVALFLAGAVATASPALAQQAGAARAFTLGASGGLGVPVGDFGERVKTGFNVGAHLAFKPAVLPFGVRVEGQFNRFGIKGVGLDDLGGGDIDGEFDEEFPFDFDIDGNARIISGTINGVLGVPAASSAVRPYLIGGAGVYNEKVSINILGLSVSDSRNKFGLNGGAGIEFGLGGLAAFIEARYHVIFDAEDDEETGASGSNTQYVPISFGIKF